MNKEELFDFLSEYRHRKDLKAFMLRNTTKTKVSDLDIRKLMTNLNKSLIAEGSDLRIVRTKKGYHLTDDPNELMEYALFDFKQAITMLKRSKETMKMLGLRDQLSLFVEDPSIRELVS